MWSRHATDPATDPGAASKTRFQDLAALLSAAPDAMLVADNRGQIVELNEQCAQMFGYHVAELVGTSVDALVPASQRARHRDQRAAYGERPTVRKMHSGLELEGVRKDGTRLPVDVSLAPFETDRGSMVLAAVRDVSRSRHDERLFRQFVEAAPDAILVVDRDGRIQLVNARAGGMFGYEPAELIGESVEILMPERQLEALEPAWVAFLADPYSRPLIGAMEGYLGRRKDGSELPVEVSVAPLATEDGELFLAHVRDSSERLDLLTAKVKAEERERAQEAASRAKDAFLATVSHELRTPLTSILGFAELMVDGGELTPECAHFVDVIVRNARRELLLVQDVLTLTTISAAGLEIRPSRVDLAEVVRRAAESALPAAQGAGVCVRVEAPQAPLWVECDDQRIGQLLDSLLSNALKFTPSGGAVWLRLYRKGAKVRVEVADSGIGIEDEEPDRVFERLYRSRNAIAREVPGMGIGLTIAAAIAEAHQGTIQILDTSPAGTTFGVNLPLVR